MTTHIINRHGAKSQRIIRPNPSDKHTSADTNNIHLDSSSLW